MKKIVSKSLVVLAALAFLVPFVSMAKGGGSAHSNAPSTGTQMKGKERAKEVGKGKKKGLEKQHEAKKPEKKKPEEKSEETKKK